MKRLRSRSVTELKARRRRATASVPDLAEVLRGTLRRRYVRCGKAGCHCQQGPGHGPFVYLSVTLGVGRSEQITIATSDVALARRFSANYARAYQVLEEVSALNRELLRRRVLSDRVPAGRPGPRAGGKKHG
jgi:hypothetical protein